MIRNKDFYPGVNALLFTLIFPAYWIWFASFGFNSSFVKASSSASVDTTSKTFKTEVLANASPSFGSGLTFDYFVWILLGFMTLYLYSSLKSALLHRHNYSNLNLLIHLAMGSTIFLYRGIAVLELSSVLGSSSIADPMANLFAVIFFAGVLVQGLVDIVIGIVLFRDAHELPDMLRIFGIITMISGIFGITLIFAVATVLTMPLSALVLGIYFLNEEQMIDII